MNKLLWTVQVLLALLFLFAGVSKLVLPIEEMNAQATTPMPGAFLRFIGVCETLGALGLILPGLLRIKPGLTALAAAGLTVIMIGAVGTTIKDGSYVGALIPLVTGLLTAMVAWQRWRRYPLPASPRQQAPQQAA